MGRYHFHYWDCTVFITGTEIRLSVHIASEDILPLGRNSHISLNTVHDAGLLLQGSVDLNRLLMNKLLEHIVKMISGWVSSAPNLIEAYLDHHASGHCTKTDSVRRA